MSLFKLYIWNVCYKCGAVAESVVTENIWKVSEVFVADDLEYPENLEKVIRQRRTVQRELRREGSEVCGNFG